MTRTRLALTALLLCSGLALYAATSADIERPAPATEAVGPDIEYWRTVGGIDVTVAE